MSKSELPGTKEELLIKKEEMTNYAGMMDAQLKLMATQIEKSDQGIQLMEAGVEKYPQYAHLVEEAKSNMTRIREDFKNNELAQQSFHADIKVIEDALKEMEHA